MVPSANVGFSMVFPRIMKRFATLGECKGGIIPTKASFKTF